MNYYLLFIPLISLFIGWGINTLLINLFFYMVKPYKILGITSQGLFAINQQNITDSFANYLTTQISFQYIEKKITHPEVIERIMPFVEKEIDQFLRVKLTEQMPMISMFIGESTISQLKKVFMAELRILFPKLISNYLLSIQDNSTFETLIKRQIASIKPTTLEKSLRKGLGKGLQIFRLTGAVTGFIIGLLQVIITLFLS